MTGKVRLVKKLDVTELSGEKVMIDFESGKYFLLKGVANDIWNYLQDDEITLEEISDRLTEEYDITKEACCESVEKFIGQLESYNFVELID